MYVGSETAVRLEQLVSFSPIFDHFYWQIVFITVTEVQFAIVRNGVSVNYLHLWAQNLEITFTKVSDVLMAFFLKILLEFFDTTMFQLTNLASHGVSFPSFVAAD